MCVYEIIAPRGSLEILVYRDLCPTPVVVDETNARCFRILCQSLLACCDKAAPVIEYETVRQIREMLLDVAGALELVSVNETSKQFVYLLQVAVDFFLRQVKQTATCAHPLFRIILRTVELVPRPFFDPAQRRWITVSARDRS
jgi:hypothetical protein